MKAGTNAAVYRRPDKGLPQRLTAGLATPITAKSTLFDVFLDVGRYPVCQQGFFRHCPARAPPAPSTAAAALPGPRAVQGSPPPALRLVAGAFAASSAPGRRPPAPAAAPARAAMSAVRNAALAGQIRHSAPPGNPSPGNRCRRPRSARAPEA